MKFVTFNIKFKPHLWKIGRCFNWICFRTFTLLVLSPVSHNLLHTFLLIAHPFVSFCASQWFHTFPLSDTISTLRLHAPSFPKELCALLSNPRPLANNNNKDRRQSHFSVLFLFSLATTSTRNKSRKWFGNNPWR